MRDLHGEDPNALAILIEERLRATAALAQPVLRVCRIVYVESHARGGVPLSCAATLHAVNWVHQCKADCLASCALQALACTGHSQCCGKDVSVVTLCQPKGLLAIVWYY